MSEPEVESTAYLLSLVRGGDDLARERLLSRYLPMLKRWAHGRLPEHARGLAETDDLVQVTLIRAIDHVHTFQPQREGAFLAYLRQTLLNALRDEIRRSVRLREDHVLDESLTDSAPSLLEQAIGKEIVESYEAALASLPATHQEAVILRIEFGMSHQEIADAIGSPSANAARMTVSRALVQLSEALAQHRSQGR
jgi:RNA polymerase sigma-70 factor (ECF subfamily)